MKILTLNFLTCARKTCKQLPDAFPLHPREAELETVETSPNPRFLRSILPRLEWNALKTVCTELGFPSLPEEAPSSDALLELSESNAATSATTTIASEQEPSTVESGNGGGKEKGKNAGTGTGAQATGLASAMSKTGRDLHSLLIETSIVEGKLVCGACGHEYAIKEGIANFLLPSHLV